MGKKKKAKQGLFGVTEEQKQSYKQTAIDGTIMVVTSVAAAGAGAAIGRHSLAVGLPLTYIGVHKKNKYLIAAGIGLTLANGFQGFQPKTNPPASTQGIGALDVKQIATEAKERVTTFFKNFAEKLYLPKSGEQGASGLGEDQVTYFVNPYSSKELDMSAIDRIQEQIAAMNRPPAGLNDVDREF